MKISAFRVAAAATVVAVGVLAVPMPAGAADDVTMFKSAPSVEELEKALKPKVKTRSIQFGESDAAQPPAPPPPQQQQQQQQPVSYQPPPQPAPVAPPQQTSYPPQQQANLGQAVGFPINFDLGSATIKPESIPFLDAIAGLMRKDPSLRLVIEGHTDASGNYMTNVELSRARAFAVMNSLVAKYGIEPIRLQAIGKGPMEPLNAANPYGGENRRVQFRVMG
ncbi:MAG: OmpA family protein [Magnetospirillum sp.]|nr:OmpA family protein [Magnetospirillum sp.]